MVFYQTLDEIFDLLYAKLGTTNELTQYKQKLIYAYENEDKYNSETLLKKLVPTYFKIDENGCVITC
jgi:hypothetical protein